MNILLVDDNQKLNSTIKDFLELKNYSVFSASNGNEAIKLIDSNNFDLYIIDVNLPAKSGIEIVKYIRSKDLNVPIIMITASLEVDTFVNAFKTGCNEYIKKPFHLAELDIRINNIFNKTITDIVKIDNNYSFDLLNQELLYNNEPVKLRKKENRLLEILIKNRNKTVSTQDIIDFVWENEFKDNYPLRQLVSGLKKKIPDLKNNIKSINRVGYRFEG